MKMTKRLLREMIKEEMRGLLNEDFDIADQKVDKVLNDIKNNNYSLPRGASIRDDGTVFVTIALNDGSTAQLRLFNT